MGSVCRAAAVVISRITTPDFFGNSIFARTGSMRIGFALVETVVVEDLHAGVASAGDGRDQQLRYVSMVASFCFAET
jgi:hypothetical protein